jgi:O-acetyl-ADP-ribose deacetylase (regulator of RNase III)
MPKFIFFDYNKELIDVYKKVLGNIKNTYYVVEDLDTLLDKYDIDVLVSPANSFGRMTGGIDYYYKKKFPQVETNVKNAINKKKYSKSTDLGYFLPVGKSVIVRTGEKKPKYLISTPTMFTGNSNIKGTNNIYLAFTSILNNLDKYKVVIGIPGLGTGVGGLSALDSANQILKAFNDYYNK